MKMIQTISIASALLLAVGCANQERTNERQAQYNGTYPIGGGYDLQYDLSPTAPATYGTGRGPQGMQSKSDNTIVGQVRETLQRDPEIAFVVPNIQISANNGAIVLNGSVQSEEQKRQIMTKVLKVNGVLAVNNQLTVMSGPNGGQGLDPTSSSGSERLYKDAAGQDSSTNNALNQNLNDNGASQLYREGNPGEKAPDQNLNNNQPMP